ncbi:MAG: hypothetical protein U0T77_01145 [Chitinophagales bacterium]
MKKSHIKENSIYVFLYLLLSVLLISCDKEASLKVPMECNLHYKLPVV